MLKDNLAKKLAEHEGRLTRNVLATRAGISQASFSQIMTGVVKNPGVYTIAKIAKELNCSIDELLGRTAYVPKKAPKTLKQIECKPELALHSGLAVLDMLDKTKQDVSFETLLDIIATVYKYSIGKNSDVIDEYFANWFTEYLSTKTTNEGN